MALNKDTLKAKGFTQEQIDYISGEFEKEVNAVTAERDGYKSQLDTAQKALEGMKDIDVAALQTRVSELTTQLGSKDNEIAQIKADYAFSAALKAAIGAANGRNEKAITALLDVESLKTSKNQEADIKAAIEGVKKDNDYLFANGPTPRVVSVTTGINNDAQTKKEQANEALRSLFGKGE